MDLQGGVYVYRQTLVEFSPEFLNLIILFLEPHSFFVLILTNKIMAQV